MARSIFFLERPHGRYTDDGINSQFFQGKNIGTIIYFTWCEVMTMTMTRKEVKRMTFNFTLHDFRAGISKWSAYLDLILYFNGIQFIDATSANDGNFNICHISP